MPSGKKRKVAQMKQKCIFLSHCEDLNRQSKPCTLRLPCPMHPTGHPSASRMQTASACCGCSFCTVRSVAQSGRLCVPKVAAEATVCGLGGLGWRHADPVPMVLSIRRAASSCAKMCQRRMLLRGFPFVPSRRERHVIGDPNLCRCTQDGRRVGWCCFAHHVDRQPSCVPICVRYSEEVAESSIGLEGCLHHLQFPWALTFNTSGLARL